MFTRRLHVSLKYCSCQQLADHVINEKDNRMLKLKTTTGISFVFQASMFVYYYLPIMYLATYTTCNLAVLD